MRWAFALLALFLAGHVDVAAQSCNQAVRDYMDLWDGNVTDPTRILEILARGDECEFEPCQIASMFKQIGGAGSIPYCPSYFRAFAHHELGREAEFVQAWESRCKADICPLRITRDLRGDLAPSTLIPRLETAAFGAKIFLKGEEVGRDVAAALGLCDLAGAYLDQDQQSRCNGLRSAGTGGASATAQFEGLSSTAGAESAAATIESALDSTGADARSLMQGLRTMAQEVATGLGETWRQTATALGNPGSGARPGCLASVRDFGTLESCLAGSSSSLAALRDTADTRVRQTLDALNSELGDRVELLDTIREDFLSPASRQTFSEFRSRSRELESLRNQVSALPTTGEPGDWSEALKTIRRLAGDERDLAQEFVGQVAGFAPEAREALRQRWNREFEDDRATCRPVLKVLRGSSVSRLRNYCTALNETRPDPQASLEALKTGFELAANAKSQTNGFDAAIAEARQTLIDAAIGVRPACDAIAERAQRLRETLQETQRSGFEQVTIVERAGTLDRLSLAVKECELGWQAPFDDLVQAAAVTVPAVAQLADIACGDGTDLQALLSALDSGIEGIGGLTEYRSTNAQQRLAGTQDELQRVWACCQRAVDAKVSALEARQGRIRSAIELASERLGRLPDRVGLQARLKGELEELESSLNASSSDGWVAFPSGGVQGSGWEPFAEEWAETFRERSGAGELGAIGRTESRVSRVCSGAVLLDVAASLDEADWEKAQRSLGDISGACRISGTPLAVFDRMSRYFDAYILWLSRGRMADDPEIGNLLVEFRGPGLKYDPAFEQMYLSAR